MKLKQILIIAPAALVAFGAGAAINEAGAIACINDKWDEKEVEKDHKLVDFAGR